MTPIPTSSTGAVVEGHTAGVRGWDAGAALLANST